MDRVNANTCTLCFVGEFTQGNGTNTYVQLDLSGRNRWGDYLDAARDPNGTGIWIGGEHVIAQDTWGTDVTLTKQAIDTSAPFTTATLSPGPNAAGWNNTNVSVLLNASDFGIAGVRRITFSASGANPIATTRVPGSFASVPISANGVTNVFFFATDNWGNVESTKVVTVRKDSIAPLVTQAPIQGFALNTTGTNAATPTVPVKITWSGTDTLSGVCDYDLFRSDNNGSLVAQTLPSSLTTTITQQLSSGLHRYGVVVKDCAGNATGIVLGLNNPLSIRQEVNTAWTYVGAWTQVADGNAMNNGLKRTLAFGATATMTVNARAIAWGARRDTASGTATAKIDATAPVNVNLQNAVAQSRRIVFVRTFPFGSHTIQIRNLATAGHPKATIDFIAFLG